MLFLDYIEKLKMELKKNKEIKNYRIVNNISGKNLILIEIISKNESKIIEFKKCLLKKYEVAIEDIIIIDIEKKEHNSPFISKIKELCPENNVYHGNISYSGWKNKTKESKNTNIIAGFSFKGGVGRSQTLAYLAYTLYKMKKKVVVLDCDFEAPGISDLLTKSPQSRKGTGILDYLIDINLEKKLNLEDYSFTYKNGGNLIVFPSGIRYKKEEYLNKISKISFGTNSFENRFEAFIEKIENKIKPDYILIDLRAGMSEISGKILKEVANKRILFFGGDNQSKLGMEIVLNNINSENTYLVNTLIRYTSETAKEKYKQFHSFVDKTFNGYTDKVIKLFQISEFLDGNFEGIETVVNRNITSLESTEEETIESVVLIDLLYLLFPEIDFVRKIKDFENETIDINIFNVIEKVEKNKNYKTRYNISEVENQWLRKAVGYKRLGEYEKALGIYKLILLEFNPSSLLYTAIAKVLICKNEYKEAIKILKKSNEFSKLSLGVEDFNIVYHIETLEKIINEKMDKEKIKEYIISISGDRDYDFVK